MPTDFRASQIQTNKIIASGSTGTTSNALLLIYPISKQSGSNQGFINTSSFGLTGIGTDVFMFVSGAIGAKGTGAANSISAFGGDLHVSGNLSFSTGSNRTLALETIADGTTLSSTAHAAFTIKASNVVVSGAGGYLYLSGGNGGYTSGSDAAHEGGHVTLLGGIAGESDGEGTAFLSEGGWVNFYGGVGGSASPTQLRPPGSGGGLLGIAGTGGSSSLLPVHGTNDGGIGGSVYFYAGTGGSALVTDSFSYGGTGGVASFESGRGGHTSYGTGGTGGAVSIKAGNGGNATGPGTAGPGGGVTIQGGHSGLSASLYLQQAGFVKILGGRIRESDLMISGSYLQIGSEPAAARREGFARVFFNKSPVLASSGFPGYDIFFFVSGTITTGSSERVAVFGGSVVVSGALRVGSSSTNYITESGGKMTFNDSVVSGATLEKMNRMFIPIGSYTSTNQLVGNPQVAGQAVVSQSEVGTSEIRLRNVLSTTNATATSTVLLYNITSGAYVEIGGAGITTLSTTNTTPEQLQSVNLIGAVNFGTGSNIYEVQIYTSNATYRAVLGSSMFVCV